MNFKYAQTNQALSLNGVIPWDDTIPQAGEGTELLNVTITPARIGDLLVFEGSNHWSEGNNNSSNFLAMAVFQDGSSNALFSAADGASNGNARCTANASYPQICTLSFRYVGVAGSTAQTTYRLRVGMDGQPVWINSSFSGRELGGSLYSTLSVMELAP